MAKEPLFQNDADERLYLGLIYGVMVAMLLYNLVLFISVREMVYAAYVIYLAAFILIHATYNGHLYPLLWPDSPIWGNWANSIFTYLFIGSGLFFAIQFLELQSRRPIAYRWANWLALTILISFIASPLLGGYGLHVSSAILWIIVYAPFVLILGFTSLVTGNRAARYFFIATFAGFIGSFITALSVLGLIPFQFFTYHAVDMGMVIDAVLLSLALADRLKLARIETEQARTTLLNTTRLHAKQLESTVEQRTLELRKANATKDKFFAIVAHDLRGPIGGLRTLFHEVVLTTDDFSDDALKVARMTTKNTGDFLEQLLTWARSQKGEIDYHPVSLDLTPLLAETQQLFTAQALAKGVQLDLNTTGPSMVFADMAMIQTVLRNLTSNALKFTPKGGSVTTTVFDEDDDYRIEVTDTGVGMSLAAQQALFHLDAKPQSTPGTQNELGTGLGLILSHEFVERHRGTISVMSKPEVGSTFYFTLPKD